MTLLPRRRLSVYMGRMTSELFERILKNWLALYVTHARAVRDEMDEQCRCRACEDYAQIEAEVNRAARDVPE